MEHVQYGGSGSIGTAADGNGRSADGLDTMDDRDAAPAGRELPATGRGLPADERGLPATGRELPAATRVPAVAGGVGVPWMSVHGPSDRVCVSVDDLREARGRRLVGADAESAPDDDVPGRVVASSDSVARFRSAADDLRSSNGRCTIVAGAVPPSEGRFLPSSGDLP